MAANNFPVESYDMASITNGNALSEEDERAEIVNALSIMQSNVHWKIPADGAKFSAAEEIVWNKLLTPRSRLSGSERRGFAYKLRDIDRARSDWIRNQTEEDEYRIEKGEENRVITMSLSTIIVKILELLFGGIAIFKSDTSSDPGFRRALFPFGFLALIVTVFFLLFNVFSNAHKSRKGFVPDIVCCGLISFGWYQVYLSAPETSTAMILGFVLAIAHLIELLVKVYFLADGLPVGTNSNSGVKYSAPNIHQLRPALLHVG